MEITLLTVIEILGTLAFAISGIRLAAARRFDWFGAYVVGFITATGGGTLRDLLLGYTPFWILNISYLVTTGVALVITIMLGRYLVRLNNTFFIFDTIGLALFVVVGMGKTLDASFPYWVAVVMGTITGAAGGILRDILINQEPLVFRKEIYALACIIGGIGYWAVDQAGMGRSVAGIFAAAIVIAVRLLAVKYRLGLPKLKNIR